MADNSVDERYPEHEKLREIADKSQTCGEFIEWLADTKGLRLYSVYAGSHNEATEYYLNHTPLPQLLAEFFEIDLDKIETEKRAMLDEMRAAHDAAES